MLTGPIKTKQCILIQTLQSFIFRNKECKPTPQDGELYIWERSSSGKELSFLVDKQLGINSMMLWQRTFEMFVCLNRGIGTVIAFLLLEMAVMRFEPGILCIVVVCTT